MLKILIMGLPGSGKTTFASKLIDKLCEEKKSFVWLNGDNIRKMYNDWDFSWEGRLRQTERITEKANICKDIKIISICDYVCPTQEFRKIFNADILIWMDTIKEGRFEDTNKLFQPPTNYDFKLTNFESEQILNEIINRIRNLY